MNSVERIKQLEKEIESERRNIQTCMHFGVSQETIDSAPDK